LPDQRTELRAQLGDAAADKAFDRLSRRGQLLAVVVAKRVALSENTKPSGVWSRQAAKTAGLKVP